MFEERIVIYVITETWLQSDGDDVVRGELKQDGYNLDDIPRPDRKGGGIAYYIETTLKSLETPVRVISPLNMMHGKLVAKTIDHHIQKSVLSHKLCL